MQISKSVLQFIRRRRGKTEIGRKEGDLRFFKYASII